MADWQEKQQPEESSGKAEAVETQAQTIIAALRHRQGTIAKLAEMEAEIKASLRFDERKRLATLREPLLDERQRVERERQEKRKRLEQQRGLEWAIHLEERRRLDERQQAEVAERRRVLRYLLQERQQALTPELEPDIEPEVIAGLVAEALAQAAAENVAAADSQESSPADIAAMIANISANIPEYFVDDAEDDVTDDAAESSEDITEDIAEEVVDEVVPPVYDPQLAQNIADALGIEVVKEEEEEKAAEEAEAEQENERQEEPAAEEPEEKAVAEEAPAAEEQSPEAMAEDIAEALSYGGDFEAYLSEDGEPAADNEIDNEINNESDNETSNDNEIDIGAALEADAAGKSTQDEIEAQLNGGAALLRASIFGETEEVSDIRKMSLPPNALLPLLFLTVIFVMGFCTYGLHFKVFLREVANVAASEDFASQSVWANAEQLIDRWEADGAEYLAWKEPLVALDGLAARVFDKRFVRDTDYSYSIIRDNHGWLQFITFDAKPREIVRNIAEYQELEVPILYVQPTTKFIEGYTEFPPTLHDKTASNVAQNLALLDEAGVPYLDLRQAAVADGLDPEQMFYRTDHHWRVETAFWAVSRTVAELEELWGWQLDPEGFYTDLSNWQATAYSQNFLGSQGRRVGRFYGGLDDFTLLSPGFTTRFRLERKLHTGQLEVSQGSFEDVILDKSLLEEESVYTNRYGVYWGADYPTLMADNLLIGDEGLTVMIIKDSYSLPYGAFLATMVDKLYMVDLRYFAIEGLAEYIRDVQPDLILIMYS